MSAKITYVRDLNETDIPNLGKNSAAKIKALKNELANTDYKAIKFFEGELSAEEYEPIKQKRKEWRKEINKLETAMDEANH